LDNFPRILILTAGFGDGHNSAARNLADAFHGKADTQVCDPCHLGNPLINGILKKGYRYITTHTPKIWSLIYQSSDRQDFSKPLPFLQPTENVLGEVLEIEKPNLIVCTYPLYPYLLERLFKDHPRVPVVTVVTDSLEINAAWTRSPSDYFFVTDSGTQKSFLSEGISQNKVKVTGFPTSIHFPNLEKIRSDSPTTPFRILYFPTRRMPQVRKISQKILEIPNTEMTIVLGRSFRTLYHKAKEISASYPGRIKLRGWTRKVPELLCSHHLIIGKAGGATVHESLAAHCPMLVYHRVPGQEEGNIRLLERYGVGHFTESPDEILYSIQELLANDAALWRQQKEELSKRARPNGAYDAADFILNILKT